MSLHATLPAPLRDHGQPRRVDDTGSDPFHAGARKVDVATIIAREGLAEFLLRLGSAADMVALAALHTTPTTLMRGARALRVHIDACERLIREIAQHEQRGRA